MRQAKFTQFLAQESFLQNFFTLKSFCHQETDNHVCTTIIPSRMELPQLFALGILLIVYVTAQIENEIEEQVSNPQYPTYDSVPSGLTFSCKSRGPGYYADPDAGCQVWHWCLPSGAKYSFLCPNGTVFNQRVRVCDWWFNVDCSQAPDNYNVNDDLYKPYEPNTI